MEQARKARNESQAEHSLLQASQALVSSRQPINLTLHFTGLTRPATTNQSQPKLSQDVDH
jgi:hypothetical protein